MSEMKERTKFKRPSESIRKEKRLTQPKFRVKWDGKYIPGITEISGLKRNTEVLLHRAGAHYSNVIRTPGQTIYEPLILIRDRVHDKEFEQWVNKVWNWGSGLGSEVSLKDFRKNIIIDLFNDKGQLTMSFKVYRCWPSEYYGLGPLNNDDDDVPFESITLEHEGWERDYEVVPPA